MPRRSGVASNAFNTETRVLMVGPGGHGRWHLRNLQRLGDRGFRLVGIHRHRSEPVDLDEFERDVPIDDDLPALLRRTRPDITIICTPIHTHVTLALAALQHGSAVLLEKPPTATMAGYEELLAATADGPPCQVGFQSLGSTR